MPCIVVYLHQNQLLKDKLWLEESTIYLVQLSVGEEGETSQEDENKNKRWMTFCRLHLGEGGGFI